MELRLDRALVTQQWLEIHSKAKLFNIEVSTSDHTPIFLEVTKNSRTMVTRKFRFENAWLRESMCKDIVVECWDINAGKEYNQKIRDCQEKLSTWGKGITGNLNQRVRECKHRLQHLKQRRDSESVRLYGEEQNKLYEILTQKEIFWRQRAKQLWLQHGDQNNKFFHAAANTRRKNNQINRLKNDVGDWLDWSTGLDRLIPEYFEHIFTATDTQWDDMLIATDTQWIIC